MCNFVYICILEIKSLYSIYTQQKQVIINIYTKTLKTRTHFKHDYKE